MHTSFIFNYVGLSIRSRRQHYSSTHQFKSRREKLKERAI